MSLDRLPAILKLQMIQTSASTSTAIPLVAVACDVCGQETQTITVANGVDFEYATCSNSFSIVRCNECGLHYLNPRPEISTLNIIYPPSYEPFHFHESANPFIKYGRAFVQKKKVKAISRLVPPDASIIDVGCGSGYLLSLLKRYGSPDWKLYGNDFSEVSLANLERLEIEAIAGRFEALDTAHKFDLIILNQTIEHLDSPSRVVEKASHLVKPGGALFIETPSTEGLDARLFRSRYWGGYHFPRHWSLFSESSLRKLVEMHGFENVQVEYLASPAFWVQSLHHMLLDRNYPAWAINFWTIRNPAALAVFTLLDTVSARLARTSNVRLVARKRR